MSLLGKRMAETLKEFAECEHKTWKCEGCHCRADRGTVASPERARINKLEEEAENLQSQLAAVTAERDAAVRVAEDLWLVADTHRGNATVRKAIAKAYVSEKMLVVLRAAGRE